MTFTPCLRWLAAAAACLGAAWGQSIVPSPGTAPFSVVNAFPNLTFEDPVAMLPVPGTNKLAVAGRQGKIWVFDNFTGTSTKTVFLDISAHCQGWSDSGLLGIAFHPQYGQAGSPNRGYIYVWYSYTPGPLIGSAAAPPNYYNTPTYNRLSRFTVPDGATAVDPNSELVLINQFDRDLWHDGGGMFFGGDGYLYITTGDEGGLAEVYGMSQKTNIGLFGGVLRIDVDRNAARSHPIRRQPRVDPGATVPSGWPATYSANYYIPNDNPFVDPSGNTLEEFYAIGLRSPHRMTRDPVTGNVWIGDVGQAAYEEINLLQKGANFGWAFKEGFYPSGFPGITQPSPLIGTLTDPVYAYPHLNNAGCVIGGYVYRGGKFASQLGGLYIFGDYNTNFLWTMNYSGSGTPVVNYLTSLPAPNGAVGGLSSFGVDANNELYMLTMGPNAVIYTLAPPGSQGHLINLSTRGMTATGGQILNTGFVVAGSGSKQFLVRGVGPTLTQFGITSPSPDTSLTLADSAGKVAMVNTHWCTGGNETALASAATSCGAFALPVGSYDSALIATVGSGNHTAQLNSGASGGGLALAEVYDLTPAASSGPQLVNLSCSAPIAGKGGSLVGGFVIGGNAPMRLLIRAVGPGLNQFGVQGTLAAPLLTLYDSSGAPIKNQANAGWSITSYAAISATANAVGAFPLAQGSNDAALLVTLAPGAYTAQITSNDGSSGIALLELYAAP